MKEGRFTLATCATTGAQAQQAQQECAFKMQQRSVQELMCSDWSNKLPEGLCTGS